MNEKRWLYFALGVTTAISVGAITNQLVPLEPAMGLQLGDAGITFPDGTVQTTAAVPSGPSDPRLAFYLSNSSVYGGEPLDECAVGYHMASLWEISDPSGLRYAFDHSDALVLVDSGHGPPTYREGWIRTGNEGIYSFDVAGRANCKDWTNSSIYERGTTVKLPRDWDDPAANGALVWGMPFVTGTNYCDALGIRVWCVEDYPGAGDCQSEATAALCQDGLDNDCDSYVDCDDWDCGPFCS